ncbi:hypothetical protein O7632_17620 [Solwaraspora sp. WMMD406]|nr:hypothetical protein [Solwaraspora sp. WMMD406]MDG4765904.1 hypothetical protein [Solwaraspora sp. WMMD406]
MEPLGRSLWLLLGVAVCRLTETVLDAVTTVAGTIQAFLPG